MDEFGYLSVIISVILGLSIAQLLQGISQVINARDRVRVYWPTMAWAVLLLLADTQAWWAMFGYRNRHTWTFVQFTIVLLEAIMLYLLAAIVLPNIPDEGEVDLRSNYFRHAGWFFGSLVFLLLDSLLKSVVVSRRFTWKTRSRVSFVLDYNCVYCRVRAQRALSQGICLHQFWSFHRIHRAALSLAALSETSIVQL